MKRRPVLAALATVALGGCSDSWPDTSGREDSDASTTESGGADRFRQFWEPDGVDGSRSEATRREDGTTDESARPGTARSESTRTKSETTDRTTTKADDSTGTDDSDDRGGGDEGGRKPESGMSGESGAGVAE